HRRGDVRARSAGLGSGHVRQGAGCQGAEMDRPAAPVVGADRVPPGDPGRDALPVRAGLPARRAAGARALDPRLLLFRRVHREDADPAQARPARLGAAAGRRAGIHSPYWAVVDLLVVVLQYVWRQVLDLAERTFPMSDEQPTRRAVLAGGIGAAVA